MNKEQQKNNTSDLNLATHILRLLKIASLAITEPYIGPRMVKAEVLRRGTKSPKELPRSVRRELAFNIFNGMRQSSLIYTLDPVNNMVSYSSVLECYGSDVIADLIREKVIIFTALNQSEAMLKRFEDLAIEDGWRQE